MVHDAAVGSKAQTTDAGVQKFDPLDLQAHAPLHEGCVAIEGHGGTVIKTTGDGLLAVFDDAAVAFDAALGNRRFNLWLIVAFGVAALTLATLGVILSAAYALWLYRKMIFGNLKPSLEGIRDIGWREVAREKGA